MSQSGLGSEPEIGQVSRHAGIYTAEFVAAVLSTVPRFGPATELLECAMDQCCLPDATVFEALAVQEQVDPQKIKQTLHRLHKNLGHPSNQDLVRVLKHGQASEEAIRMARELQCDFCTARQTPTAANPGKTSAVQEFNERVGLDVKYLPGWKTNQKIPALNCVDHASSFQLMLPFFETETAAVIRKLYLERWVQWAGPPKEIVIDPARTNLGKSMVEPTELEGTSVMVTAGGAHWQLGKTEVHGGWFARVLSKVLEERNPTCKEEWLECVVQSHVKNQMIQNHGFTPSQRVFGKNPSLPGDLLSEPIAVVPSTASLQDEAIARTYEVRNAARRAVLALQDDRTLRKALLARPRRDKPFSAGEVVAYWRDQKWSQGVLSRGGKWHGNGIVIGLVGRNVIIAHRNHIIRCAPEQVRLSTNEEKALIETHGSELLGIKDMIEGGTFRSAQYVDLLSQAYPPQEEEEVVAHREMISSQNSLPSPETSNSSSSAAANPASVEVSQPVSPDVKASGKLEPSDGAVSSEISQPDTPPSSAVDDSKSKEPAQDSQSYGPVRRSRVPSKGGPLTMFRPAAMRHEGFCRSDA